MMMMMMMMMTFGVGEKKVWGDAFAREDPAIARLYLHRETCTPEPGYETGQGGPACSVQ